MPIAVSTRLLEAEGDRIIECVVDTGVVSWEPGGGEVTGFEGYAPPREGRGEVRNTKLSGERHVR